MTRGGVLSWNCPNVSGEDSARLGLMKFTLLKALKASARNCNRWPSHGIANDFATERSQLKNGARRTSARVPVRPGPASSKLLATSGEPKMLGVPVES